MEEITAADYMYGKRVCEESEIKNLEEYHDLNIKGDTLHLVDVFENFRNMCIKICVSICVRIRSCKNFLQLLD